MFKVLIAGDYCPQERGAVMLSKNNFSFLDEIKLYLKEADYSIVNFEAAIVQDNTKPIEKSGTNLRTTSAAVDALKYAGFDCVTLANNHFRDFGDEGCITTINELQKHNIDFVGGGCNLDEAQKILYKQINGKTLAIVNFCETEFSIATDSRAGSAPLDAVDNYNQITQARSNADYVLVIVHGGHEHYQLPSPRMQKLYRHFITIGADAVVNHHQHCYSGYEYFNNKPIIYGLGNFYFDEKKYRDCMWNEGYMVEILFNDNLTINLIPYIQCNSSPTISLLDENSKIKFSAKLEFLNNVIMDDVLLQSYYKECIKARFNDFMYTFHPYWNRLFNSLACRGYISWKINRKRACHIYNRIKTESWRDVAIYLYEEILKK